MSGGTVCSFHVNNKRSEFHYVLARECNHSRFNGGHWTPSAYSEVGCTVTGQRWRTRASYVEFLKDLDVTGFLALVEMQRKSRELDANRAGRALR